MTWRATVLTILPEMFPGPLGASLAGKALSENKWALDMLDIRDFAKDKHRSVDDTPAGGGAGMVMRADVWIDAAEAVWNDLPLGERAAADGPPTDATYIAGGARPRTVLLTPRGRPLDQALARELAAEDRLVLCCGRYEGIDERVHDLVATDEVSIGDYVLFGGEVAAAVVIEAVTRHVPGVMGNAASPVDESFSPRGDGQIRLLEHPQYTRPAEVRGHTIPSVLTSGDHGAVDRWRDAQARALTAARRPDLLADPGTATRDD